MSFRGRKALLGAFRQERREAEPNRSEAGCVPDGSDQKICVVAVQAGDGILEVDGDSGGEAGGQEQDAPFAAGDVPRTSRTADLWLIHAAYCGISSFGHSLIKW